MRAVVTGCSGFIGSHLTQSLLGSGWSILGLDSFAPTYNTMQRRQLVETMSSSADFEFIEGNINEVDLRPYLDGADVVFHLAARPGVRASWADFAVASEANILATQRVLDSLIGAHDTKLVFASSSSVYGMAAGFPTVEDVALSPISPYGVTKAACEALVTAYASQSGINAASLRFFTVYGPRQRSDMAFTKWIRAAFSGDTLYVYGDGSATRDFTYVGDVVAATIAVAESDLKGHEVFNVAGGSPANLVDTLELIEELVGRDISVEYVERAKGDPHRTGGDTTHLQEKTGWAPEWSLRDGLSAQVEWIRGLRNGK